MPPGFVNLHRHDTYSLYDGFGLAKDAAAYAVEIGQSALGLTNHGNVCGLVEHYYACKDAGIKPVLGVEAYFQPRFKPEPKARRYHLTILCESTQGYHNLMQMVSVANREQFYKTPVIDWPLLQKYHQGLIILSGCLLGYIPRLVAAGRIKDAELVARKFKELLGDRFYLEVQPIDAGPQRKVNRGLEEIGKILRISTVITLDSHYTKPKEFASYRVMHQLGNRPPETAKQYEQRYMMRAQTVADQWQILHLVQPNGQMERTLEIAERCNVDLSFKEMIPRLHTGDTAKVIRRLVFDGLQKYVVDKTPDEQDAYLKRAKRELKVITGKGFEDYFLLCYDVVDYARSNGISVSGRGSVCGSLVAFALGITRVDPLILGTYFERFLRPDKDVTPDIDLDFSSEHREQVVNYVLRKFEGRSTPISNFGYWRAKGLWNKLAALFEVDNSDAGQVKAYLEAMSSGNQQGAFSAIEETDIDRNPFLDRINKTYDGVLHHFCRLYGQPQQIGRHAAGVAITADSIEKYVATLHTKKELQTSYDMDSLAKLNITKVDILGLATNSIISALEKYTGESFDYRILTNPEIRKRVLRAFRDGRTEGIFQFEKGGAKRIIEQVKPVTFADLMACSALNRPGPDVQAFVDAKNGKVDHSAEPYYEYLRETYGAVVYQEQVMRICRAAGMEWAEADRVMKSVNAKAVDETLLERFVGLASKAFQIPKRRAEYLYRRMTLYSFNKGHTAGYTLIGYYLMYYKLYHPLAFWWATLRYEDDDYKSKVYQCAAAKDGVVIFPPHCNGTAHPSIEEFDGGMVIRLGLTSIKGIGVKAAMVIQEEADVNGPFKDDEDFHNRLPKRYSGKGVTAALDREQALEFNQKRFLDRAVQHNSRLAIQHLEIV